MREVSVYKAYKLFESVLGCNPSISQLQVQCLNDYTAMADYSYYLKTDTRHWQPWFCNWITVKSQYKIRQVSKQLVWHNICSHLLQHPCMKIQSKTREYFAAEYTSPCPLIWLCVLRHNEEYNPEKKRVNLLIEFLNPCAVYISGQD